MTIVALSLAPFLLVDAPAVLDYPNHLARFYILAHPDDPILSRMYQPHWAILPNVGMDVLGRALLGVLRPDVGGRILLALSLVAPPIGAVLYARAAFGRWTWWSLGAAAIAYNGIFFFGFMNFLLGLGVALAGAAAWRVLREQGRNAPAVAAGAVVGLVAFFCHLLGFAFFALLIGAQEVEPLVVRAWRRRHLDVRAAATSAAFLAAALAPGAVLYVLCHHQTAGGDYVAWAWRMKLVAWLTPFMIYDWPAIIVSAVIVVGVAILVWRKLRLASGVGLALAAIAGLYLVAPAAVGGGEIVDARLPLMGALLFFAGAAPGVSARAGRVIGAALALVMVGRAAVVAQNWIGHAADLAELRAQLAYVPPGAAILPSWTQPPSGEASHGRELPHLMFLNDELAALAVIERRAFWPLEFADPAQQPLVVRAPYASMAQPIGLTTPWRWLFDDPPTPAELAKWPYLRDWRRRFDFVLLAGPPPAGAPPVGLRLVRRGEATSLYRIVH